MKIMKFSFIMKLELITITTISHLDSLSKREWGELGNGLFNGAQTSPVVAYFANIIECEQDVTIANSHNCASIYFQVPFSLPSPSSLLKLPNDGLSRASFRQISFLSEALIEGVACFLRWLIRSVSWGGWHASCGGWSCHRILTSPLLISHLHSRF